MPGGRASRDWGRWQAVSEDDALLEAAQLVNGLVVACLVIIAALGLWALLTRRRLRQRFESTNIMLFGKRVGTTPLGAVDVRCGLVLHGATVLAVPTPRGVCRVEAELLSLIWAQKVYATINRSDAEVVVEPEGVRRRSIVVSDADTKASIRPEDWDSAFAALRNAGWI